MLADTTFIIDIMANETAAVKKSKELEDSGIAILVGAPTIFELYVGLSLSRRALKEKEKITSVIESLAKVPLDSESARVAGKIYAEKLKAGSRIDPEDAMLAGIGRTINQKIITRNIKHFADIEGVTLEVY